MNSSIYILGFTHGGRTLLSRMLRAHSEVEGITDDLFGADGGTTVLQEKIHPKLTTPKDDIGGWEAGLQKKQRCTEKDFTQQIKKEYFKYIPKDKIFLDKSSGYIVKTRFIQKLWEPEDVYFIFVMRNPYVLAYKPLLYKHWYPELKKDEDFIYKGCKNINESIKILDEDSKYLKHLYTLRFEDFIARPEEEIKKICEFVKIKFHDDMIPKPPNRKKWYPIRSELAWQHRIKIDDYFNSKILATEKYDRIIEKSCGDLIKRFGYNRKPYI